MSDTRSDASGNPVDTNTQTAWPWGTWSGIMAAILIWGSAMVASFTFSKAVFDACQWGSIASIMVALFCAPFGLLSMVIVWALYRFKFISAAAAAAAV